MNYLQIWFVVIAGLLGIGIPFLFLGLELPNAMHSAIMNEAAEYVILDEEDENFWAKIPGRMDVNTQGRFIYLNAKIQKKLLHEDLNQYSKKLVLSIICTHDLAERKYSNEKEQRMGK